jgi:NAD(P)-dependent dehydrogenase (short-subunit alcohol dehydrogenase family)
MKNIIVVTGASSGFGLMAAQKLAQAGHVVYAGMRETQGRNAPQVAAVQKFSRDQKVELRPIEMDVSSQSSVDQAITRIVADNGRLDVVIHNAGHMVFGPAEAFTAEQLAQLYDINVLSTQRVNRAALPQLRKQRKGLLVWVSSSSTRGGTPPYLAPYFAAKAGMDAMAVSRLSMESPIGCAPNSCGASDWRTFCTPGSERTLKPAGAAGGRSRRGRASVRQGADPAAAGRSRRG